MRTVALATAVLLLAGCSTAPADAPATPSPTGPSATGSVTSGAPSTGSATQTSPVPVELTVPEVAGEIARSVFGEAQQDVISGEAVEGATLEARVACMDLGGGSVRFEVLDARENSSGWPVMEGEFGCDGSEVFVSTIAPFSGPLQITFTRVPETAVEGYAILSAD